MYSLSGSQVYNGERKNDTLIRYNYNYSLYEVKTETLILRMRDVLLNFWCTHNYVLFDSLLHCIPSV